MKPARQAEVILKAQRMDQIIEPALKVENQNEAWKRAQPNFGPYRSKTNNYYLPSSSLIMSGPNYTNISLNSIDNKLEVLMNLVVGFIALNTTKRQTAQVMEVAEMINYGITHHCVSIVWVPFFGKLGMWYNQLWDFNGQFITCSYGSTKFFC